MHLLVVFLNTDCGCSCFTTGMGEIFFAFGFVTKQETWLTQQAIGNKPHVRGPVRRWQDIHLLTSRFEVWTWVISGIELDCTTEPSPQGIEFRHLCTNWKQKSMIGAKPTIISVAQSVTIFWNICVIFRRKKWEIFGVFKGRNSTHFSSSEKKLQIFFSTKLKKQKKKTLVSNALIM